MEEPYLSRFLGRIDTTGTCWLWRAGKTTAGYGVAYVPAKSYAHRVSYEHFVGPIPPGREIAHSCDTRHCVNPAHLRIATHAENMADMRVRGRGSGPIGNTWNQGSRSRRTTLTEEDVAAILSDPRTFVKIARDYGVSRQTISGIRQRRKWTHVPTPPGYVLRSMGRPRVIR
jgi:hypothetical protein